MARRTIRARRASPYLLYLVIALSILTVACAVGWAWMYSLRNEDRLLVVGEQALRDAGRRGVDALKEVLEKYPEDRNVPLANILEKRDQLAKDYRSEIQRLTDRLANNPFTTQEGDVLRTSVSTVLAADSELLAAASLTLQKSYAVGAEQPTDVKMTSPEDAIRSFMKRTDALVALAKQNQATVGNLETQLKGIQEELAVAKAAHKQQTEQLNANLTDEKNRVTAARDSALGAAKQLEDEKQRILDRYIAMQRQNAADKERLEHQILVLNNNLKDLGEIIKKFREVPTETGVDGHIVSVAEQGSVGYGDLGKKDGVLLGMTFSIFGASELGRANPQPKAECRIVKVMQDACELRLYYPHKSTSPVVSGDVLLNPVYDRERRLRFCLVGKMDINGDGLDDTEQLKALIQEFGGRVDPTLTVQTDYLVVGEEPIVPPAPAPSDSPMVKQMYQETLKRFIEYKDAIANAKSFSIPILNLNRFLGLVGIAGRT
jgi:hypothetical protein